MNIEMTHFFDFALWHQITSVSEGLAIGCCKYGALIGYNSGTS